MSRGAPWVNMPRFRDIPTTEGGASLSGSRRNGEGISALRLVDKDAAPAISAQTLERLANSLAVDAEAVCSEFRAVDLLRPQDHPLGRAVLRLRKSLADYKEERGELEGWPL